MSNNPAAIRRSIAARVAVVLLAMSFTASCMVANPFRTVPALWGSGLAASTTDVPYVTGGAPGCPGPGSDSACGGSQTLDVFRSTGPSKGTIVFFHGGGFTLGDKTDREELGPFLRQTHLGWDVVSVNYRLSDPTQLINMFPTAIHDAVASVNYLRSARDELGINTDRIVAAGHSAGGTIAALLGTAWNSGIADLEGAGRIDGYVPVAGIHDFRLTTDPWGSNWTVGDSQRWMASPTTWIDRNDPPAYVIHGDRDFIVWPNHSRRLKQIADDSGFGGNVRLDIVDFDGTGSPLPAEVRVHSPMGGSNADDLDAWFADR